MGWDTVIALLVCGWIALGAGMFGAWGIIQSRIYPNDNTQPLATVCQVDEKINDKIFKYDGWIMLRGEKYKVNIRETTPDGKQVKVGWREDRLIVEDRWLPIEDFHKNYSTEELSEMVRELQAKKKR